MNQRIFTKHHWTKTREKHFMNWMLWISNGINKQATNINKCQPSFWESQVTNQSFIKLMKTHPITISEHARHAQFDGSLDVLLWIIIVRFSCLNEFRSTIGWHLLIGIDWPWADLTHSLGFMPLNSTVTCSIQWPSTCWWMVTTCNYPLVLSAKLKKKRYDCFANSGNKTKLKIPSMRICLPKLRLPPVAGRLAAPASTTTRTTQTLCASVQFFFGGKPNGTGKINTKP